MNAVATSPPRRLIKIDTNGSDQIEFRVVFQHGAVEFSRTVTVLDRTADLRKLLDRISSGDEEVTNPLVVDGRITDTDATGRIYILAHFTDDSESGHTPENLSFQFGETEVNPIGVMGDLFCEGEPCQVIAPIDHEEDGTPIYPSAG